MSNSAEFNGWCIFTGIDFRKVFFVKDTSLPKIENPDYDPNLPTDGIVNREFIYQPKNLTGYTAKCTLRDGPKKSDAELFTIETGSGITIDGPLGSVELFIDNTDTGAAPILDHAGNDSYFDVALTPPVGDNTLPVFGTIPIIETVTDVV